MEMKNQISTEQLHGLLLAASAIVVFTSTASGGGIEMLKEMINAGKFMADTLKGRDGSRYGELVDALIEKMKESANLDTDAAPFSAPDLQGMRAAAKQYTAEGVRIADSLPGGDGYKLWLMDMARQTALTKTGGLLGIGASAEIDRAEQDALDELAELLGM
jgi:hypothetical protein